MKTIFAALSLILLGSLAACLTTTPWQTVRGSGNVISETRAVSGFSRVSVSGAGELTVVQGDEESLVIEADDNLLPYIRSDVSSNRLSIGPQAPPHVNLRPTQTIRYHLKLRNLSDLQLSGAVRAQAHAIRTEELSLGISGSGSVEVGELEAQTLAARISGSGSASLAGSAARQHIQISGSGDHRAANLECSEAEVRVSGSGDAALWVKDALSVHISGSGRVAYRGNPHVESHVSGSGRIRRVE